MSHTTAPEETASLLHPSLAPSPRWMLFVWLDPDRLERTIALSGRGDPAGRAVRGRIIRWYRAAVLARTLGWGAGFAALLQMLLLMILAAVVSLSPVGFDQVVGVADIAVRGTMTGIALWLVLFVLVGVIAPTTTLARRVRRFEFLSRPGPGGVSRASAVLSLQASGGIARTLFRIVTRHVVNAGVRPDLTAEVSDLALRVMLRKPDGGVDGFRGRQHDLDDYVVFLRDVVGLAVAERLDALPRLIDDHRSLILVTPEDAGEDVEALRRYLQPLRGRTVLAVVIEIVLPVMAILVSLTALVVGLLP